MFPFDRKVDIYIYIYIYIYYELYIPVPDTSGIFTPESYIRGIHTIDSLQKGFQNDFNPIFHRLIEQNKIDKKTRYRSETKEIKNKSCKICIEEG
jgi:transglutaminase-like putative cysteine protease